MFSLYKLLDAKSNVYKILNVSFKKLASLVVMSLYNIT